MADNGEHDGTEAAQAQLQALISRFEGDGAAGYERLRLRLATFFRLRAAPQAEALADEALDRLARRLAEGIEVQNLGAYALGIARLLALEAAARQKKEQRAAREELRERELYRAPAEGSPAAAALGACLGQIPPAAATFILAYYASEGGEKRAGRRQRLALAAGTTLNALRNRALRIRLALEKCVRERLAQEGAASPDESDVSAESDT